MTACLYKVEYCDRVIELGKLGWSTYEMAMEFDVSRRTMYDWTQMFPEFAKALDKARDYSLAWDRNQARAGLNNPKYNANLQQVRARYMNEKRGEPLIGAIDSTPNALAQAIANMIKTGDIEPEVAEKLSNTLRTLVTVDQESNLRSIVDEIKKTLEQK